MRCDIEKMLGSETGSTSIRPSKSCAMISAGMFAPTKYGYGTGFSTRSPPTCGTHSSVHSADACWDARNNLRALFD